MGVVNENIRFLRKNKGLTQEELANKIGIKRSVVGAYEEVRAEPKIQTLQNLAHFFNVSIDGLVNIDLSKKKVGNKTAVDIEGSTLRILPVIVKGDETELISIVPVKAVAGYLNGYSDSEFIEELPRFNLPVNEITQNKTYRLFQIKGDSMTPINSGSYIICEYLENWREIRDNKCYVLITKDDGVVYKRILNRISENNKITLKSDNGSYQPYSVDLNNILEVWKAIGFVSFNIPDIEDLSFDKLSSMVMDLKKEVNKLKRNKN
jgi:transcriptional regulator with XRE-family HTH domain